MRLQRRAPLRGRRTKLGTTWKSSLQPGPKRCQRLLTFAPPPHSKSSGPILHRGDAEAQRVGRARPVPPKMRDGTARRYPYARKPSAGSGLPALLFSIDSAALEGRVQPRPVTGSVSNGWICGEYGTGYPKALQLECTCPDFAGLRRKTKPLTHRVSAKCPTNSPQNRYNFCVSPGTQSLSSVPARNPVEAVPYLRDCHPILHPSDAAAQRVR